MKKSMVVGQIEMAAAALELMEVAAAADVPMSVPKSPLLMSLIRKLWMAGWLMLK